MILDHFSRADFSQLEFEVEQLGFYLAQEDEHLFEESSVVLIGIEDADFPLEANQIRKQLYQLYRIDQTIQIYDLGNFSLLAKEDFSFMQLADCISELLERNQLPVLFGGSQKTMYSLHQAFIKNKTYVNAGMVAKSFGFQETEDQLVNDANYLLNICQQQNSYLFNFIQMAYQTYLINPRAIQIQSELNFEGMRLGTIRDDIKETEPLLRDLDLLGVSMNALKFSETGNQLNCEPNGLYAEELAQLLRYAGMSDKMKAIGFFDYRYRNNDAIGAKLFAQTIWCFLEAFTQRKREWPDKDDRKYMRYTVHNDSMDLDLVFLKSELSGRWWVQMPKDKATLKRQFYIPCSYNDYQVALDGDIPERWLKGFQKLG